MKTPIDFSNDGTRHGHAKGAGACGDSDEDEDDSDVPLSGAKTAAQSSKRRVAGTRTRPARNPGPSSFQDEVPKCCLHDQHQATNQFDYRNQILMNSNTTLRLHIQPRNDLQTHICKSTRLTTNTDVSHKNVVAQSLKRR